MSEIKVKVADEEETKKWDSHIEKSPQGSIFHQYDFLKIMEKYSNSKLHLLIGYKGQQPIGLFPIFEISKGPISTVFSPPPYLLIPHLGPVLLNYETLNQRKIESLNNGFIEGCLNWINRNIRPKFIYILTVRNYTDVRPFQWNCFDVSPTYTYLLDLNLGEEGLLKSFDSTRRENIQNCINKNVRIKVGGLESINFILKQVKKRYEEQGIKNFIDLAYFRDIYNILPKNQIFSYLVEVENEPVGGAFGLKYKDKAYGWQGCPKPVNTNLPVNDLVIWRMLKDSIKLGLKEFDFVGANTFRLCRYKSFFNPRLAEYYEIKKSTKIMSFILKIFKQKNIRWNIVPRGFRQ